MRFYKTEPLQGNRSRPGFFDDPAFPSFFNGLSEGAALVELDGRIRLVNAAMERLLRTSRADLLGSDLTRHLRGTGRLAEDVSEGLIRLRRTETTGSLPSGRAVAAHLAILRLDEDVYAALLTLREAGGAAAASGPRGQFRLASDLAPKAPFVTSPLRRAVAQRFEAAWAQGLAVHLTGESGTGKTALLARICAAQGQPVATLACAALHPGNFDAELFGTPAGPGEGTGRIGQLEAATGGTLVLEGIDRLAPALAGRLLSVIDTVLTTRGTRLVSTACQPLWPACGRGEMPEELYFRLSGLTLGLPPLREEPAFLTPLREAWLAEINRDRPRPLLLSAPFCTALAARTLPGNIRELIHILRQAAIGPQDTALPEALPVALRPATDPLPTAGACLKDLVREFEIRAIENSVAEHGSKRSAAKALGIDVATLIRKTNRSRDAQPTRSDDT